MKKLIFKGRQVRIASLFQAKDLHLRANLLELSHCSEDLVRIASLLCKTHVKVKILKLIIFSFKQKAKKQFF